MTTTSRDQGPRGGSGQLQPSLLHAKLTVPRQRPGTVRRTRLLHRLRATREQRIILIVAPPGYGKTSVLAQCASKGQSVAWLNADDGDNDPVVLFGYLAAALDHVAALDPDVLVAIRSGSLSTRATVGQLVSAAAARAPLLMAIDDAHRITDRACLDALAQFIDYLPAGSQVAIAGRGSVGLPVARWRAAGSIIEIGPSELAMDDDEALQLVRNLGRPIPEDVLAGLTRSTEGWPALLVLAAMAHGRSGAPEVADISGHERTIAEYLRSEVLQQRSARAIEFLTRTSILERLNGAVCEAVTGQPGSGELLVDLARSTILVDEYGGSYRYHSLLKEFLQDELDVREPGAAPVLHDRAARWYEDAGDLDLAVDHAFAAHDLDHAAALVGAGFGRYHWSARRVTVQAWIGRFGDAELEKRPWLAVLGAWEGLASGDVPATEHLADIVERGSFSGTPPDGTASFESGRAMLRSAMCRAGADDSLANAIRAVALESAGSRWRDFALWLLAFACLANGDEGAADEAMAEAVAAARSARNDGLAYAILGHRALLAMDRNDWAAAAAYVIDAETGTAALQVEGYLSSALACVARARMAVHGGDLGTARREVLRCTGLRPLLTAAAPAGAVLSLLGLARVHLGLGDAPGARAVLAQAAHVIRLRPDLGVLPAAVAAMQAEVARLPIGVAGASSLTTAELRVLPMLPYYLSFREIGQRLGVRESTVKTHADSIYGKLGASTRGEAVELAVEAGFLDRLPIPERPGSPESGDARRAAR